MFDLKTIEYGIKDRPPRMIICGVEKIGKSTFASQSNAPIVCSVKGEEGIDSISCPKTPVVNSFSELMDIITALYQNDHEFETIVIDSISALEPLIWTAICQEHNVKNIEKIGYGKGYTEALSMWRDLTEGLDALRNERGMASILIGHVVVRTFSDPLTDPYDQYAISLHKAAADVLFRWSDVILFANSKVYTRGEDGKKGKAVLVGERKLFTQKRPSHPGGGRGIYGQIPYELDLSWNAFQAALKEIK